MAALIPDDVDALIVAHLPLVRTIVNRELACRRVPCRVDRDDLIQVATVALIGAARRFDANHGASFATFVGCRIQGAVLDELRRLSPLSRRDFRRYREGDADFRPRYDSQLDDRDAETMPAPAFHIDDPLVLARIDAALRQLPPQLERIVRLYLYDELGMKAIGDVMFVNEARVSQLYARALEQLRPRLADLQEHAS